MPGTFSRKNVEGPHEEISPRGSPIVHASSPKNVPILPTLSERATDGADSTASTTSSFLRSPLFNSLVSPLGGHRTSPSSLDRSAGAQFASPASEIIRRYETSPSVIFKEYTSWKESKWGEDNLDEVEFCDDDMNLELSLPSNIFTNPLLQFPSIEDLYGRIAAFLLSVAEIAVSAKFYFKNPHNAIRAITSAISIWWIKVPPKWVSQGDGGPHTCGPQNIIQDDGDWERDDLLADDEDDEYPADDLQPDSAQPSMTLRSYCWQIVIFFIGTLVAFFTFALLIPAAIIRLLLPREFITQGSGNTAKVPPATELPSPRRIIKPELLNRFMPRPDTWEYLRQLGTDAAAGVESRLASSLTAIKNCGKDAIQSIQSFGSEDAASNPSNPPSRRQSGISSPCLLSPMASFSDLRSVFRSSRSSPGEVGPTTLNASTLSAVAEKSSFFPSHWKHTSSDTAEGDTVPREPLETVARECYCTPASHPANGSNVSRSSTGEQDGPDHSGSSLLEATSMPASQVPAVPRTEVAASPLFTASARASDDLTPHSIPTLADREAVTASTSGTEMIMKRLSEVAERLLTTHGILVREPSVVDAAPAENMEATTPKEVMEFCGAGNARAQDDAPVRPDVSAVEYATSGTNWATPAAPGELEVVGNAPTNTRNSSTPESAHWLWGKQKSSRGMISWFSKSRRTHESGQHPKG